MLDNGQHLRLGVEPIGETRLETLRGSTDHMKMATNEACSVSGFFWSFPFWFPLLFFCSMSLLLLTNQVPMISIKGGTGTVFVLSLISEDIVKCWESNSIGTRGNIVKWQNTTRSLSREPELMEGTWLQLMCCAPSRSRRPKFRSNGVYRVKKVVQSTPEKTE